MTLRILTYYVSIKLAYETYGISINYYVIFFQKPTGHFKEVVSYVTCNSMQIKVISGTGLPIALEIVPVQE